MIEKFLLAGILMVTFCGACSSDSVKEDEIPEEKGQVALYNKEKEAIAYIDYEDEATLYMFGGEPVAYMGSGEQVYGFNGKLLGWYVEGVLYDKSCYAAGAKHGIVRGGINTAVTRPEKLKSPKHARPVKSVGEEVSGHPLLKDFWSTTSLEELLNEGIK